MHHLRPTSIAGLLLVLVPATAALSSCGFDYPTDRVNTIAAGENNRDATVDVLGVRVLATAAGEGRVIGALANNLEEDATLDAVTSPDGRAEAEFEPITVPGREGINLAEDAVIPITGDFTAGNVIDLEFAFSTGETVTLNVPVVKPCFQYSDLPTENLETENGAAADAAAEEDGEKSTSEKATESESPSEESSDATFNCSDEAPAPEGGH